MFCHDTHVMDVKQMLFTKDGKRNTLNYQYCAAERGSVVHSFLNIMAKWCLDGGHSPSFSLCSVDVQSTARQDSNKTIHLTTSIKAQRWKSHPSSIPYEMSAGEFVGSVVNRNGIGGWRQWEVGEVSYTEISRRLLTPSACFNCFESKIETYCRNNAIVTHLQVKKV